MATSSTELMNLIPTLTPAEQDAVAAFIKYLKEGPNSSTSTRDAIEEFMREHAEILQLLAK
jgi:hypothetical protein